MANLIGHLHVDAIKDHHRNFEYAGAGELWDLEECTVPVYTSRDGYWAVFNHPGVCNESWFQNRLGSSLGSDNRCTEPKAGSLSRQMDFFHMGTLYAAGELKLAQGWIAKDCGNYSDGRPMVLVEPE